MIFFRVVRGFCAGALERLHSSSPSSRGDWRLSALCCFSLGSIRDAAVHPWTGGVGVEELFLPHHVLCLPELVLGGLLTPSRILPFAILESLVVVTRPFPGVPLILRACLPSCFLLLVPMPAGNMFFSVLCCAPRPSLHMWFSCSAAAEYCVSRGFQPAPSSACLGALLSYPDWDTLYSAISPQQEEFSGVMASGLATLGIFSRVMSSILLPPAVLRAQLGAAFYTYDIVHLPWSRPLLLPLLMALQDLPSSYLWGIVTGHTLDTDLYLEVLQLLICSVAVQLALPWVCGSLE